MAMPATIGNVAALPVVFGVETDINFLNTSPTGFDIEPPETVSLESKLDWFGTLRGRAGIVVHDSWLLYGTAGLAYGGVDHKFGDNCVDCSAPPDNFGPFSQSNKDTKVGWTAGGGVEFLHDAHWLLRTEALFVDLGSETHSYTPAACAAALGLIFAPQLRSGMTSSGWPGSDSLTNLASQIAWYR